MEMNLYSIAIRPNSIIISLVGVMKSALNKEIGAFFASMNSEAHISLFRFWAYEKDLPMIKEELGRITQMLSPFLLQFFGFGDLPSNVGTAFVIKPVEESAKEIIERCEFIRIYFSKRIRRNYMRDWKSEYGAPHMSIGRRLKDEWVIKAYRLFTQFEDEFFCDNLVLRRFDSKRGQYEVIESFPMLGKNGNGGTQLALFGNSF